MIYIAEKNMRALFGHYADVVARLSIAARTLGIQINVGCSSTLTTDCNNYFKELGITLLPELRSSELKRVEKFFARAVGVSRYKRVRKSLLPKVGGALLPVSNKTPALFLSAELSDVYVWAQKPTLPKAIFGFWGSPDIELGGAIDRLATLFKTKHPRNIVLGAYDNITLNELLPLREYVQVERLPCPYENESAELKNYSRDKFTVGLFGWMRNERGGLIKEQIKQACVEAGFNVRDDSMNHTASKIGSRETQKFTPSLGKAMHGCDAILWPADPIAYRARTSGIVFNALANGIPLVLPSNCRPYDIVSEYKHPHAAYSEQKVESILSAIHQLHKDILTSKSTGFASRELFAAKEGSVALIKCCAQILS